MPLTRYDHGSAMTTLHTKYEEAEVRHTFNKSIPNLLSEEIAVYIYIVIACLFLRLHYELNVLIINQGPKRPVQSSRYGVVIVRKDPSHPVEMDSLSYTISHYYDGTT